MQRIYFSDSKRRNYFFTALNSKLHSWQNLAKFIHTSRSMLEKYRKGDLCMPENKFEELLQLLKDDDKIMFKEFVIKRDSNWGQKIGGNKAYKTNRKNFEMGRRKANLLRSLHPKYDFDINLPLSEDLCEIIGVVIGDGFTNKYGSSYQTQITGDAILDLEYYHKRLTPLCERLFGITPKITIKDGGIRLNIYSKRLFELLTLRFKIPAGEKSDTVFIPEEIWKQRDDLPIKATLRGMFDTDGGIGFDKRKTYKKPYVRVNYTSTSQKLISQVDLVLSRYSIAHSIHEKKHRTNEKDAWMIQINGEKNVRRFLNEIGFSNPRHLNKISHINL